MSTTRAEPAEGFSLGCAAPEQGATRRSSKAQGYVPPKVHLALRAHCWYRQTSQSDFVGHLVQTRIQQLERSGQITPDIIDMYLENVQKPSSSRL